MLEIFKQMISNSTHPLPGLLPAVARTSLAAPGVIAPRYVVSTILEFLRTLLENQIPQQPSQQHLLVKFILVTKDTQMLHSLLQYHVLADSLELSRVLVSLGSSETRRLTSQQMRCSPSS